MKILKSLKKYMEKPVMGSSMIKPNDPIIVEVANDKAKIFFIGFMTKDLGRGRVEVCVYEPGKNYDMSLPTQEQFDTCSITELSNVCKYHTSLLPLFEKKYKMRWKFTPCDPHHIEVELFKL